MSRGRWILTRPIWLVVGALALVAALAVASGYQLAPGLVSAAPPRQETPQATATPAPSTAPGAPERAAPKKEQAWLGIQIAAAEDGVRVEQVLSGSPAEKGGLKQGDLISAVNGNAVADPKQLIERITALKPGDKASLAVQRNGSSQTIEVALGARPQRLLPVPKALPFHPDPFGGLGGLLPELREIPADQRFDHARGGTFSFTDKNGNSVTMSITPGVLTVVTADTIALRPNGASAEQTYRIGDATRLAPGKRAQIAEIMKADDKVVVVSRQDSDEALAVYDQTAIKERRGQARPQGSALPRPDGKQSRVQPPGALGEQFRNRLDGLERRLGELRQRLDRQPAGPAL